MPLRSIQAALDEEDRGVLELIAEHGWMVMSIPEDDEGPGYSFSIGLWETHEHPELVVFGFAPEDAQAWINDLGTRIAAGERFVGGVELPEFFGPVPARFVAVPQAHHGGYLGNARWAYQGDDFEAVQLLWPDGEGRWPDDPAAPEGFREDQPVLADEEPLPEP